MSNGFVHHRVLFTSLVAQLLPSFCKRHVDLKPPQSKPNSQINPRNISKAWVPVRQHFLHWRPHALAKVFWDFARPAMLMAIKPQDVQTTQQLAVLMEKNPSANPDLHRYIPLITINYPYILPTWLSNFSVAPLGMPRGCLLHSFGYFWDCSNRHLYGSGWSGRVLDLVFTSMTWLWHALAIAIYRIPLDPMLWPISAFRTLIGRAAPWKRLEATVDAPWCRSWYQLFTFINFITSFRKWRGSDFGFQATPACSGHQLQLCLGYRQTGKFHMTSSGTIAMSPRVWEASRIRGAAADQINPVETNMEQGVWQCGLW